MQPVTRGRTSGGARVVLLEGAVTIWRLQSSAEFWRCRSSTALGALSSPAPIFPIGAQAASAFVANLARQIRWRAPERDH